MTKTGAGSQKAASSLSMLAQAEAHRGFFFPQVLQMCTELQPQDSRAAPTANTNPGATKELIQGILPSPFVTEFFLPYFMGMAPTLREDSLYL